MKGRSVSLTGRGLIPFGAGVTRAGPGVAAEDLRQERGWGHLSEHS